MQLISVRCQNCSAPLEVPADARFVTCRHCGSQLQVEHTGSASFTSLLEKIDRQTAGAADDLAIIKLQNDLERIDREWMMERERHLITNKDGSRSEPGQGCAGGAAVGVIVVIGAMIALAVLGSHSRLDSPIPALFFLVFIVVGVIGAATSMAKASDFAQAREAYEKRRAPLVAALTAKQKGRPG